MKKLLLVAVLFAFGVTANAANFRVGIIDMHKIMTDSPQVQQIKNDLQTQFKPKEAKLMKARDTLKADAEKLRKDSAVMSKADREKLQKKVMKEQRSLQEKQIAFQQEAVRAQNAAMKTMIDKIKSVSKNIANKEKLNVIITSEMAVYFDDALDITNQVLSKLKASS